MESGGEEDQSKTAILQFTNPNDAKTALLITKATLNGNVIEVEYANKSMVKEKVESSQTPKEDDSIETSRTPSKLASYLATGYELKDTATSTLKTIDEKFNIVESLHNKLEEAKKNIQNIDQMYKISEQIKSLSDKTLNTTKGISEKFQSIEKIATMKSNPWIQSLTSSLTLAFESAAGSGASFSEKHFGGIIETIKGFTQNLTANFYNIEREANEIYNNRKKSQETENENNIEDQERELLPNDEEIKESDPLLM